MVSKTLPLGTILSGPSTDYQVVEVLGCGSFGITYRVEQITRGGLGNVNTGTFFAMKEFFMAGFNGRAGLEVTGADEGSLFSDYLHKFISESKLLASLSKPKPHPGIVKVIDAFEDNGTAYYVMEYLPGGSLEKIISTSPGNSIDERRALYYMRKLGEALEYMHSRHMAHLDLKPGNIMLRDVASPVIIDFGLSKQYTDDGRPETSTKLGAGTPGYAPIEQASYKEGQQFPSTMDVYALGATLYKMLTGIRPPEAADVLNDGLPLEPLKRKGVSDNVIAIITKAMAPVCKDRYKSMAEMLKDIPVLPPPKPDNEKEVEIIDLLPPASKSMDYPKKKVVIVAAVVAVVVICVLFFFDAFFGGSERALGPVDTLDTELVVVEEPVVPVSEFESVECHRHPSNFDLCVSLGEEVAYFTEHEWSRLPGELKQRCVREGVYLTDGKMAFLVRLNDSGKKMTWEQATSNFRDSNPDQMPNKKEAELMVRYRTGVNSAIVAFGGDKDPEWAYWTKTGVNQDFAWAFGMNSGKMVTYNKTDNCRVRLVRVALKSTI